LILIHNKQTVNIKETEVIQGLESKDKIMMMKIFRIILRKKVNKMMTKTNQLANLIKIKAEILKIRKGKTISSIVMILNPNQINRVKKMIAKSLI
jgi:hypothetical protein